MNISLPTSAWLVTRYALIISETKINLVSWKSGKFSKISNFVNDNQGLLEFAKYLKRHRIKLGNKAINVLVSVVGEDYRFEKVAHLVGKYRSDMIARKFQKLFRGTSYHQAVSQGREAIGRRQDLMLFCGVLSNEKVQPWIREITRTGMNIAGVHLNSLVSQSLNSQVIKSKEGVNVVSVCMEEAQVRHNFYIDGNLRFSRLSRGTENSSPQDVYRLARSEIEKTTQYLVSTKLIQLNAKINSYIICADDIVEPIRKLANQSAGDRFMITPVSARVLGSAIGIKKPIDEFGRDSTLVAHEMLRSFRMSQAASFGQIRYYMLSTTAAIVSLVAVLWGMSNLGAFAYDALGVYNEYTVANAGLSRDIDRYQSDYSDLASEFIQPPSSEENMSAAVNVLNHVIDIDAEPGKLFLFLSKELEISTSIQVDKLEWFISNEGKSNTGNYSYANGRSFYEVLLVDGMLSEEFNSALAYEQYISMVRRIKARPDMEVIEEVTPALVEAGGNLVGTLDNSTDVREQLSAYASNMFRFRIVWNPGYVSGEEGEESSEASAEDAS